MAIALLKVLYPVHVNQDWFRLRGSSELEVHLADDVRDGIHPLPLLDGRCWGGSMLTMLSTSTAAVYIYSVYVVHIRYHVRGTWYLVQGTDRRSLYSGVCGMWSLVFCGLRIIRKK